MPNLSRVIYFDKLVKKKDIYVMYDPLDILSHLIFSTPLYFLTVIGGKSLVLYNLNHGTRYEISPNQLWEVNECNV
jgi:hypothetical protein